MPLTLKRIKQAKTLILGSPRTKYFCVNLGHKTHTHTKALPQTTRYTHTGHVID